MRRRSALGLLGAMPLLGRPARVTIQDLEIWKVEGHRETLSGADRQFQVQPNHIYEELRPKPYHDNPNPQRRAGALVRPVFETQKLAQGPPAPRYRKELANPPAGEAPLCERVP